METADHAVAVEGNIVAQARRELRIGLDAVERFVEFAGDFTFMRQIGDVGLDPTRRVETGESRGLRKGRHCIRPRI